MDQDEAYLIEVKMYVFPWNPSTRAYDYSTSPVLATFWVGEGGYLTGDKKRHQRYSSVGQAKATVTKCITPIYTTTSRDDYHPGCTFQNYYNARGWIDSIVIERIVDVVSHPHLKIR